MKKSFNSFIGFMVALFVMSVCLTSCSDDYGNDLTLPQKKVEPADTTKTPDPQPDPTEWKQVIRKYYKVEPTADVTSVIIGQRNSGSLDSLVLKYKYIYSLAADTTLYLESAPTGDLSFTSAIDNTSYSEYTINEQGDSVCFIDYAKPYYLSNGVNLSLKTQRVRGWHNMGGIPTMYSEPNQSIGRMNITSETTEFERNDSIFGLRTNVCSVPLTLGGVSFTASATVKEIWFKALKEKPEPSFNVTLPEYATFVCGSKCEIAKNNWVDAFVFSGATQVHIVVAHLDSNGGRALRYEVKSIAKNRVVMNSQVNGVVYDSQTGLYATALIVPDNGGWSCEGFIDGREIVNDKSNAQAVEEGIKNFVSKDTSVPTPFFYGNPKTSNTNWHEYTYTSVTWSKYSKDTEMVTQTMTVKMPAK